jgi:hypothetical protein
MKQIIFLISVLTLTLSTSFAQIITTVAGTGTLGDSPDGTPATSALIGQVHSIAVDRQGLLYMATLFAPNYNKIQQITPQGTILTVAGGGTATAEGVPATTAQLQFPYGLDLDAQGQLYIAENIARRVRLVTPSGSITTIAGGGASTDEGVPATTASLVNLHGVAIHPQGGFYTIQSSSPAKVRYVTPTGSITTVAGTGTSGFSGDGGLATSAMLNYPHDVVADGHGNFYIAEQNNNRVRKVDASGIITTVAGSSLGAGFSGDNGPAINAQLATPSGLALDGAGNLFIADQLNHRVRKVDFSTGYITTVAGNGSVGFSGDGGLSTTAAVGNPYDVAVDQWGSLYISQLNTYVIRKVVGVATPFPPMITLGTPNPICSGSSTLNIPFINTINDPTSYTVSGTGIAANQTGPLSGTAGSITVSLTPAFTGSFTVTVSGNTGTSLPTSGSVTINGGASSSISVIGSLSSTGTLGNGTCSVQINGTATGSVFVFTGPNGYVFSNVYRTSGTYSVFAQGIKQPGVYTLSATTSDACGSSPTVTQQITIGGTACNGL